MKKFFLLLAVSMIAFVVTANAQSFQEVVHLKNGSAIKGVIIEQTPNESLKIKTDDGSVFAYQMSEVDKITKERSEQFANSYLKVGYRGFVEAGFTVLNYNSIGLFTTHGVQIIPELFMGIGVGFDYFTSGNWHCPLYVDLRTDILRKKTTPYIDFKIGYSVLGGDTGLYLSPTAGCRFGHFSVGVGYVLKKLYGFNVDGLNVKLGIDF